MVSCAYNRTQALATVHLMGIDSRRNTPTSMQEACDDLGIYWKDPFQNLRMALECRGPNVS